MGQARAMNYEALALILEPRIFRTLGCWFWLGSTSDGGYGRIDYEGRHWQAHVLSWMSANKSEVPAGKEIMHSCDIRNCVNPAHLSAGTRSENVRDMLSKGIGRLHTLRGHKTHCKWGHEFTPENTRVRIDGGQVCRACKREHWHRNNMAERQREQRRRRREEHKNASS